MSEVFTPRKSRYAAEDDRYRWNMEDVKFSEGFDHGRGAHYKGFVEVDGKVYKVYGMDCNLEGCACDAYVTEM